MHSKLDISQTKKWKAELSQFFIEYIVHDVRQRVSWGLFRFF